MPRTLEEGIVIRQMRRGKYPSVSPGFANLDTIAVYVMDELDLEWSEARLLCYTFVEGLKKTMLDPKIKDVNLAKFGKFKLMRSTPHIGRNVKTGQLLHVPSKAYVRFRPGKPFREKFREVHAIRKKIKKPSDLY